MDCALCSIVAVDDHPQLVADDQQTATVLSLHPAVDGHLIVLPKRHVADAWACGPELYRDVYAAVHAAASLIRERLDGIEGATIIEAVGPAGWQTIPHLHTHVLPRRAADDLQPIWTSSPRATEATLAAVRQRLSR